jgi:hypothetical protein
MRKRESPEDRNCYEGRNRLKRRRMTIGFTEFDTEFHNIRLYKMLRRQGKQ